MDYGLNLLGDFLYNADILSSVIFLICFPEHANQWETDELSILERFFEVKVATVPYKANSMTAFCRLLGAPIQILKDCIQIMKLELVG